ERLHQYDRQRSRDDSGNFGRADFSVRATDSERKISRQYHDYSKVEQREIAEHLRRNQPKAVPSLTERGEKKRGKPEASRRHNELVQVPGAHSVEKSTRAGHRAAIGSPPEAASGSETDDRRIITTRRLLCAP